MNRVIAPALFALLLLAVALGGCGGTGGTTGTQQKSEAAAPISKQQSDAKQPEAAPSPAAAKAAGETGRKACKGLTPLQAAQRYAPAARNAGVTKAFAAFIADPNPHTVSSPGFPRLVAALYATTLPAGQRASAAAGCAAELASAPDAGQASP
jgi:hypothetical protein